MSVYVWNLEGVSRREEGQHRRVLRSQRRAMNSVPSPARRLLIRLKRSPDPGRLALVPSYLPHL